MNNDDLKDLEIIDFKGVTDGQGKAVPYSKEVAEELKQMILTHAIKCRDHSEDE